MAVSARAASPADVRIACPTCGGLIHPVAGRCKHCKSDLATAHATRQSRHAAPQVAALPALGGAASAAAPAVGLAVAASPWAPGQVAVAGDGARPLAAFSQVPVPVYGRVGETPRALLEGTGTSAPDEAPGVSRWVWWVVGISAVVIVVMIVVLVWPQDKKSSAVRVGAAGDSMSTTPMPDRSGGGGSATTPDPWSTPNPLATPDARSGDPFGGGIFGGGSGSGSSSLDDSLTDLFNSLGGLGLGGGGTGGGSSPATGDFLASAADELCERIDTCGGPTFLCSQAKSIMSTFGRTMFGSCTIEDDQAERCLDAIKALSCRDVELSRLPDAARRMAPRCMQAMKCPAGTGGGLDLSDLLGTLGGGGTTGP